MFPSMNAARAPVVDFEMVVPLNKGPKMVHLILGNPHMEGRDA